MARWNTSFEIEQIKQLALIARLSTHHGESPSPIVSSRRNHCSPKIMSSFSTPSVKLRKARGEQIWSAVHSGAVASAT